ncbi:MAG: hypothetical protein WCJ66_15385 [Verrucomicrobiota bacterium]
MSSSLPVLLNQIGLTFGFLGSILLVFSGKVGVISKDGSIIFSGLDPMEPIEGNIKRVRRSQWRNRFFNPIGLGMLAISFLLQLVATFH